MHKVAQREKLDARSSELVTQMNFDFRSGKKVFSRSLQFYNLTMEQFINRTI